MRKKSHLRPELGHLGLRLHKTVCVCGGVCTCKGWKVGQGPVDLTILTFADLYNPHDDDQGQGQELPGCENVLNPGGPPHTGTVDPCEEH